MVRERLGDPGAANFVGTNTRSVEAAGPVWHNGHMAADAVAEINGTPQINRFEKGTFSRDGVLPETWNRLRVASYRLPWEIKIVNDKLTAVRSPGGLVTAMKPFMESGLFDDASWTGWAGKEEPGKVERGGLEEAMRSTTTSESYSVGVVSPSPENFKKWYEGYANQVLWPLFHGRPDLIKQRGQAADWKGYLEVNKEYADQLVTDGIDSGDFLFIQDYHLMATATYLRELGVKQPLAHFLHIPFPSPEELTLKVLPQRDELLGHLLNYDLLGFQTDKYRDNFVANIEAYVPGARVEREDNQVIINYKGRKIRANTFPISIDVQSWEKLAQEPETQRVRETIRRYVESTKSDELPDGVKLVFSLARADYSKGLDWELEFLERFLDKYPEHAREIRLLQVAQPSRENIGAYKEFKQKLRDKARVINEKHGISDVIYLPEREEGEWVHDEKGKVIKAPNWKRDEEGNLLKFPHEYKKKIVHQIHRGMKAHRLVGHYSATDVMSVPTTADGMNLVAKEYAVTGAKDGVMLLGQGAGASVELGEFSLVIDPKNIEASADALHQAFVMLQEERESRKAGMHEQVKENDIYKWKDRQVDVWHQIWDEKREGSIKAANPALIL